MGSGNYCYIVLRVEPSAHMASRYWLCLNVPALLINSTAYGVTFPFISAVIVNRKLITTLTSAWLQYSISETFSRCTCGETMTHWTEMAKCSWDLG